MAIKDITNLQQTLGRADAASWSRKTGGVEAKTDLGNLNLEGGPSGSGKSFGDFLQESIEKVNDLQQNANVAMEKLASGESQNLHETLLAVEKAEIAFKMMNQVRTKVLDSYREIMKMQI